MATNRNSSFGIDNEAPSAIPCSPDVGAISGPHPSQIPGSFDPCVPSPSSRSNENSIVWNFDRASTNADMPLPQVDSDIYLEAEVKQPEMQEINGEKYLYIPLIITAICQSPEKCLTLQGIYAYIMKHFPHQIEISKHWQDSVSRTLLENRCFRNYDTSGKGTYWMVNTGMSQDVDIRCRYIKDVLRGNRVPLRKQLLWNKETIQNHPYFWLIITGIYRSSRRMLELHGIFEYIMKVFYIHIENNRLWQYSIRYTLLNSKVGEQQCFFNIHYPNNVNYWMLHPRLLHDLDAYNKSHNGILIRGRNAIGNVPVNFKGSVMNIGSMDPAAKLSPKQASSDQRGQGSCPGSLQATPRYAPYTPRHPIGDSHRTLQQEQVMADPYFTTPSTYTSSSYCNGSS